MNTRIEILTLIAQTEQALEHIGVSKRMRLEYRREGFRKIRQYLEKRKQKYYVAKDVERFVTASYGQYKKKKLNKIKFYRIRKSAAMLEEYYRNGKLEWRSLPDLNYRAFPKQFQNFVSDYEVKMQATGVLSTSTIIGYKYDIYHLLNYLGDRGHSDFSRITLKMISDFVSAISKTHPNSMKGLLAALRSFAKYLNHSRQSPVDILPALQGIPARHKKIFPGFTWGEANRIVDSIDTSTANGKRDYAMLLLAKNTSLRGIDIVNLKFNELDWHSNKIVIAQRKTSVPLVLPLEPDVGNAIADYIINARPQISSPYIFLKSNHPFTKMDSRSRNDHD
jgi:integrase/recombinase XerD